MNATTTNLEAKVTVTLKRTLDSDLTVTFSNPRLAATFADWPIGGSHRGTASFAVEANAKKGYRVSRTTTDKNGKLCKPKHTTWSGRSAIVDGSDGRTYVLVITAGYGFVKVYRHDFMDAGNGVFDNDAGYSDLLNLINAAYENA